MFTYDWCSSRVRFLDAYYLLYRGFGGGEGWCGSDGVSGGSDNFRHNCLYYSSSPVIYINFLLYQTTISNRNEDTGKCNIPRKHSSSKNNVLLYDYDFEYNKNNC
jgi:hypothetical protein